MFGSQNPTKAQKTSLFYVKEYSKYQEFGNFAMSFYRTLYKTKTLC